MYNNKGRFQFRSWQAKIINLKSVLELIDFGRNGQVQDTGWQSSGDKAAARALSLQTMEPSFGLICSLFEVFFYDDPLTPEYMAPIE